MTKPRAPRPATVKCAHRDKEYQALLPRSSWMCKCCGKIVALNGDAAHKVTR